MDTLIWEILSSYLPPDSISIILYYVFNLYIFTLCMSVYYYSPPLSPNHTRLGTHNVTVWGTSDI